MSIEGLNDKPSINNGACFLMASITFGCLCPKLVIAIEKLQDFINKNPNSCSIAKGKSGRYDLYFFFQNGSF